MDVLLNAQLVIDPNGDLLTNDQHLNNRAEAVEVRLSDLGGSHLTIVIYQDLSELDGSLVLCHFYDGRVSCSGLPRVSDQRSELAVLYRWQHSDERNPFIQMRAVVTIHPELRGQMASDSRLPKSGIEPTRWWVRLTTFGS